MWLKFLIFFYFQALADVILTFPMYFIYDNSDDLNWVDWVAAVIAVLSVFGEAISDYQLKKFKENPENRGKCCETGFWKWSRHPNYFFEWLFWFSHFIFGLNNLPYGVICLFSPLVMFILINFITGIPPSE
mmetsp:Transcript_21819/g.3622  ORF Transcript_21819/g.3622 Transcript_21819/m.3622 type:complete len:131 (-) Transcript_21819:123-515(-)